MEQKIEYTSTQPNEENDLQTLFSQGIQLWSTTQESLEKQALEELEIFVEESHEKIPEATTSDVKIEHDTAISDEYNSNNQYKNCDILPHESQDYSKDTTVKEEEPELSNEEVSSWNNNSQSYPEDSDDEYIPSEGNSSDEDYQPDVDDKSVSQRKPKIKKKHAALQRTTKFKDDALESNYKARLDEYYKKLENELSILGLDNVDTTKDKKIKGGFKVPGDVWNKLYDYQKDGVKWLWKLHQKPTGGLLGDEMGLGKTVQIIAFLHALQYSRIVSKHCKFVGVGPSIIVCPATVIYQWVKHFHEWSPEFRVAILHQSGSHQGNKAKFIDEINRSKGIIITTYAAVLKYKGNLCEYNWHYFILDEGHKIRNPNAKATIAAKHIRTPHRLLLTGSPMQNNLTELWSLFDFTNPGMLGNLSTFTEHFANPILQGGFTNASPMQEATALSVASTLKNIISPFLLRRMKDEVQDNIRLPHKSEQVLFCSLTDEQRDIYKDYLMSEHVNNVLGRGVKQWRSDNFMKANMLMAITALRKICNHPDLFVFDNEVVENDASNWGHYKKSGKMVVVSALLKIWKKQGHRTLLFSQGRSMIQIFEQFLEQQGYKYLKMDGSTSIGSRQGLIDKFNEDKSYDVFLLTTRVGGLGINLTGANRVIIYDPDWNPATDTQARERAWRIGQEKSVTVYRLLCAGTVEEKMYQRQVWKQLLSNKVLIDPTTNKFFKSSDLFDLFSLPESSQANPETTNIFRESRVKMQEKLKEKKQKKRKKCEKGSLDSSLPSEEFKFSEDKLKAMKSLAQKIAQSLSQKNDESKKEPKKNAYQLELEKERREKLKEKEKLKNLTPQELIEYNRWKANKFTDDTKNTIDDKETNTTFESALDHSSKTANLYHKLTTKQIKISDIQKSLPSTSEKRNKESETIEKKSRSKKRKHKESIDTSGKIDGEEVEGLIKRETKKVSKKPKLSESQDSFILEHLFSKKGVSGALEHDSVVNGGKKRQSLKVRTEAEQRAAKSLEALRKSRLDNWKW